MRDLTMAVLPTDFDFYHSLLVGNVFQQFYNMVT